MYLKSLKENVVATIGVECEWLVWDNRDKNTGLCKVYNELAAQAQFPFLCFVHEDILFRTQNWGRYLLGLVGADTATHLVGIAGGKYKSRLYSGWYSGARDLDYYHITHSENGKDQQLSYPLLWPHTEERVACIDGVFMFCKKEVWRQHLFNEDLLKGFHFYDIDFSMRVAKENKVVVTNQVDIIHLTKGGDYGNKWIEQAFIFHDHMADALPFAVRAVDEKETEMAVARYWLDWLKTQPISFGNRLRWIKKQRPLWDIRLAYSLAKFLFYQPLALHKIHRQFKKNN